jgi:colanic acid biosynthesis glycosyl transferase WcaI
MHILLLSTNYWPEQTGIGAFNTWRAEYLASRGHQVTVCTGLPYYPEWKIPREYAGKLISREERNGVTVLRSWLWVPKHVTTIKRVVFEASFLAASFLRALSSSKPDLLFVVSPPLGLGITANLLSRWWGVPYVFDVEDLQPDAAADLGMLPRPVLPVLYHMERLAYRHAALLSTLTEGMRQRIISKGVAAEKVVIFPPRADEQLFQLGAAGEGQSFRLVHELDGKFLVVHSGNMGVKQGLEVVLEAAALLKDRKNLAFLLVGSGAMESQLRKRGAALRLDNLKFLPLQSEQRFRELLATTDLALVTQQRTVSDIAFPSKTVTLLSAACPVLASVSAGSEVARVIERSEGGVVIEPEEPAILAQTIDRLSRNAGQLSVMKSRGRRYAMEQWSPDRVLPLMEAELLKAARMAESAGRAPLGQFGKTGPGSTNFTAECVLPDADDSNK